METREEFIADLDRLLPQKFKPEFVESRRAEAIRWWDEQYTQKSDDDVDFYKSLESIEVGSNFGNRKLGYDPLSLLFRAVAWLEGDKIGNQTLTEKLDIILETADSILENSSFDDKNSINSRLAAYSQAINNHGLFNTFTAKELYKHAETKKYFARLASENNQTVEL